MRRICPPSSTSTMPQFPEGSQRRTLNRCRWLLANPGFTIAISRRHPIWVFEDPGHDKRIRGWLSFKPFYGRPAYSATAEVSIYVDPNVQRAGVATRLMEHAIERAPELRLTTYLAFVFAHNGPSLALCRKFGFEQWGHLPGIAVLDGTDRDLLILGRRI